MIIKKHPLIIILLGATIFYVYWIQLPLGGHNAGNEAFYIFRVGHIVVGGGSYFDGPFDNFPLYVYTLTLYSKIAGISLLSFRIFSMICTLSSTFLIYRIGLMVKDKKTATIASLSFAFFPLVAYYGVKIGIDMFAVFLGLLALYFAILAVKKSNKYFILCGIFLGLSVFAKLPMFVMTFPILYYMYKNHVSIKYYILLAIEGVIIIAPWTLYAIFMQPSFFYNRIGSSSNFIGLGYIHTAPYRQLFTSSLSIIVAIFLVILWRKYKPVTPEDKLLLYSAMSFSVFFLVLPNYYYYLLPMFAPLFLYIAMKKRRHLKPVIMIFIIISLAFAGLSKPFLIENWEPVLTYIDENYDENITIYTTKPFVLEYYCNKRYNIKSLYSAEYGFNNTLIIFFPVEEPDLRTSGILDNFNNFRFVKMFDSLCLYESRDL